MGINEILKSQIREDLLTTSDVSDMLKISRERVRQLVKEKLLPPKYIFNKNKRRQYVFDKLVITEYINNSHIHWIEPENTEWMSIPELNNLFDCPQRWLYDMTRKGLLTPAAVVGQNGKNLLCLYHLGDVQKIWVNRRTNKGNKGYRETTVNLVDKIKFYHSQGLNDTEIAKKLEKSQPMINRLRKNAGLISICRKGRPRNASMKIEHSPRSGESIPF